MTVDDVTQVAEVEDNHCGAPHANSTPVVPCVIVNTLLVAPKSVPVRVTICASKPAPEVGEMDETVGGDTLPAIVTGVTAVAYAGDVPVLT